MENSHSEVRVDETVTAVAFDALDRGEVSQVHSDDIAIKVINTLGSEELENVHSKVSVNQTVPVIALDRGDMSQVHRVDLATKVTNEFVRKVMENVHCEVPVNQSVRVVPADAIDRGEMNQVHSEDLGFKGINSLGRGELENFHSEVDRGEMSQDHCSDLAIKGMENVQSVRTAHRNAFPLGVVVDVHNDARDGDKFRTVTVPCVALDNKDTENVHDQAGKRDFIGFGDVTEKLFDYRHDSVPVKVKNYECNYSGEECLFCNKSNTSNK